MADVLVVFFLPLSQPHRLIESKNQARTGFKDLPIIRDNVSDKDNPLYVRSRPIYGASSVS